MNKTRILVVDDEVSIQRYVGARLRKEGFEVAIAGNGKEALRLAEEVNPSLVILDIMMPEMDGFEVCRRLREWTQAAIIMLSAKADESDKVTCLDLGADDYMTKPFGTGELMARVKAVLRRMEKVGQATPALAEFDDGYLKINFAQHHMKVNGVTVKLTPTEYNLLRELVVNKDKVLSTQQLLQRVWGPKYGQENEYLHVFIGRLRKKIERDPEKPAYLQTVSHFGYQFTTRESD